MPYISDEEYSEYKRLRDKKCCPNCESDKIRFIRRIEYCNSNDQNPCDYSCRNCGERFIIWD